MSSRACYENGLDREESNIIFGKFDLEGVEPHAGAGKALLNSRITLEGKQYNPLELQHLLANHVD